jgi:endonuclease/exonuclease/phosphatase family metal-dependent hydrolase
VFNFTFGVSKVVRLLREHEVDIVCFQEATQSDSGVSKVAKALNMTFSLAWVHRKMGFCNAVLSAFPIVASETIPL